MKLNELIAKLQSLQAAGHGEKPVFAVNSASGACMEPSSANVTDYVGDAGPFDLPDGAEYVSINVRG